MTYHKYTKEQLQAILRKEYEILGHLPVARLIKKPSYRTFAMYFGSWDNALKETFIEEELGYKKNKQDNEKEALIDMAKFKYNKFNRELTYNDFSPLWIKKMKKYYTSIHALCKDAGIPVYEYNQWTKDLLIQKLQEKAKEINRIPNVTDMKSPYPSYRQYYKHWGSWEDALIDAGFEIDPKSIKGINTRIAKSRKNKLKQ